MDGLPQRMKQELELEGMAFDPDADRYASCYDR